MVRDPGGQEAANAFVGGIVGDIGNLLRDRTHLDIFVPLEQHTENADSPGSTIVKNVFFFCGNGVKVYLFHSGICFKQGCRGKTQGLADYLQQEGTGRIYVFLEGIFV